MAQTHGTPCYSTSALRYAAEYEGIDTGAVCSLHMMGPGAFHNYIVHQLEPVCMLIKSRPVKVMCLVQDKCVTMNVLFEDSRHAVLTNHPKSDGFSMDVLLADAVRRMTVTSDFFRAFIAAMIPFLRDGVPPVAQEETLRIMALREAGIRALSQPGQWVAVPQ